MEYRYGARTDIGLMRMVNEDAYRVIEDRGLVVVVDGMGGNAGGDVAAAIACDEIVRIVSQLQDDDAPCWPFPPDPLRTEGENVAVTAARVASHAIWDRGMREMLMRGSGATVAIVLFDGGARVTIAYAGDVQVLRLRDDVLSPMLRPHRLPQEFAFAAARDQGEGLEQYANVVTRALGMGAHTRIASLVRWARPGDVYVACSDGVTDELDDEALAEVVRRQADDPQRVADAMVAAARRAGGRDNITVVAIACDAS